MPVNAQRPHLAPPSRSPLLVLAIAAAALLSFSACEDDSPVTRDGGIVHPDTERTPVDTTGGDGTGTVLSPETSPGATDAPNPNAGGGAGTGDNTP